MKIRLSDDGQIVLSAETPKEYPRLRALYDRGHIHLVCKAITRTGRTKRVELWLAPSVIAWQRPKGDALAQIRGRRRHRKISEAYGGAPVHSIRLTSLKMYGPTTVPRATIKRVGGYDPKHPERTLRKLRKQERRVQARHRAAR